MRIMITAITSRTWINPPTVYDVIRPRSQRIKSITAIVVSISLFNYSYEA
jgi:hypothetical protein